MFRDGGAVDADEGERIALAPSVDQFGDEFLARPRFACDEHRRIHIGHLNAELDDLRHQHAPEDQIRIFDLHGSQAT